MWPPPAICSFSSQPQTKRPHMERAQRTHTGEFYRLNSGELAIMPLIRAPRKWEGCIVNSALTRPWAVSPPASTLTKLRVRNSSSSSPPCHPHQRSQGLKPPSPRAWTCRYNRWAKRAKFHSSGRRGTCAGCTGRVHAVDMLWDLFYNPNVALVETWVAPHYVDMVLRF